MTYAHIHIIRRIVQQTQSITIEQQRPNHAPNDDDDETHPCGASQHSASNVPQRTDLVLRIELLVLMLVLLVDT